MNTFTGNKKWQLVVQEDYYSTAIGGQKFPRYVDVYWKLFTVFNILFLYLLHDFSLNPNDVLKKPCLDTLVGRD